MSEGGDESLAHASGSEDFAEHFPMPALPHLIDTYLAGPALLREAVAGLNRDQLLARPVPGKWSTLEVVCHLADFEPVYADRMKLLHRRGTADAARRR